MNTGEASNVDSCTEQMLVAWSYCGQCVYASTSLLLVVDVL